MFGHCRTTVSIKILQNLIFSSLTIVILCTGCTQRESRLANRTVIEVNGEAVSTKDFAEFLALQLRNRDPLTIKDPLLLEKTKNDLADALILQILAEQWAKKNGITVTKSDLDNEVNKIRKQYQDELSFRKMLADEKLSMESWRDELRHNLLRLKVFNSVTSTVTDPPESEIKSYFESEKKNWQRPARIRLQQIVVKKEEDAKQLYDEVQKGRDIGPLAKEFSIMPEGANGGDTGWIDKGALEVFDQAFRLNIGSKGRLVKSPYGWHIFKVTGKEPERKMTLEQVRPTIISELREHRSQTVFAAWLEERLRSSTVKRDDTILKSISLSTRID